MATLRGTSQTKKVTSNSALRGINRSMMYSYQYQNRTAMDAINDYQNRISKGEWISSDDREKYKAAVDAYTSSGNALREASRFYGTKYSDDEEKGWQDTLASLRNNYNSVNEFYNNFADDKEYGSWKDYNTKLTSYNSVKDAADYADNSKYASGVTDNRYNFINQSKGWGFANPFSYANGIEGVTDTIDSYLRGDLELTDDQIGIYNYLYSTKGKNSADEYLDFISDEVMQRKADLEYNRFKIADSVFNMFADTGNLGEYLYGFGAGIDSGVIGFMNAASLVQGNEGFTSSSQYVSSKIREDLARDNGDLSVETVLYDLANTTGNMMPSIAIGTATGGVGGAIAMGVSSAGNNYNEMLKQGYSVNQARAYGILTGTSEALLGSALSGISSLGGKISGNVIKNAVAGINNGLARFAAELGGKMTSEAIEEMAQSVLEPVIKHMVTLGEESIDIDWGEAAYSGLLGALSAGTLEGVPSIINTGISNYLSNVENGGLSIGGAIQAAFAKEIKLSEAFKQGQKNVTNTAGAYANAVAEVDPNNKAAKYAQNRIESGKNVSAYQVNRLATELDTATTNYDRNAIKTATEARLNELGEEGDVAKVADALAKQAMGEKLSLSEKKALTKSTYGEWVSSELDPESVNRGFDGEYSDFAESIGTKRVNAEAYNRQTKAETANATPENARATEAKISAPVRDVKAVIKQAAKDKVGKIEGFTEETANVMVKDYDGSVSASEYITTFDEAFKLGRDNAQIKELTRLSKDSGVIGRALLHAYDAGLQSRNVALEETNSENSVLQNGAESGIINTESESITNEGKTGTKGIRLRNGGKWFGGKNTEGQIRRMEGGAGQNSQWREGRSRPADGEAARLLDEGRGREVRVADLGILNGSKQQKVRVIENEADFTPNMKQAYAVAKKQGLTAKFFVGDNILIEETTGNITGVRGYILGNTMLIRADYEYYTSDQIARHEAGHDMIAKGQVDIKAVRKRLEETVGEEAIDSVAQAYAEAYGRTGLSADEIWEECICDSLGDMNIFTATGLSGREGRVTDRILAEIKAVTESETKAPTQTRGSPEGKASRATIPKRDKALYASGVSFLHKNFPPENERLSEAHRLATWWARNQTTETGDQTLIFMNDVCYLVECFDDALNYYQVEDVVSKQDFDYYYEGIKNHGKVGQIKSILAAPNGYDSDYKQYHTSNEGKSSANRNEAQHRRESSKVVRLDRNETSGRERSSSDRSGDSQGSSENKQKYSRELDSLGNELTKEQQEYFKDSKVRDKKGNLMVLYHGTTANFNTFKKGDVGFHFGTKGAARGRAGFGKNVTLKEVYLNITNPIVFDEDLGSWDADYRLTEELYDKGILTQAEAETVLLSDDKSYRRTTEASNKKLASLLVAKGYDGIAYSNTFETKNATTSYIVFNSNQAKEITNKTPTSNPDIRYSRELDTEYLSVVERGDMKTAQKMVDEAAKKAGYTVKAYHGTNEKFNEFKQGTQNGWLGKGIYFSDNKNYAKQNGKRVISAFLDVSKIYNSSQNDHYGVFSELQDNFPRLNETNISEVLKENGYNAISYTDWDKGKIISVFSSEQIKSADPVTYDDNGSVIPLSERFNPEQSDIRFSRELDLIDYVNEKADGKEYKPLTNRELLASALESVAVNADERKILESYNAEVKDLNRAQARLDKVGAELKELIFEKGARDKAAIERLTKEKNDLLKKINKSDKRLLKIEAMKPVKAVIEQEKKKAYKAAAEKGREALHRNVEGRHKSEARAKIKKLKQKFQSIIEHPTDRQYIPVDLMSAMIDVCDLIDTSSPLYKTDGSINKAQQARNEQGQRLLKLKAEYDKLAKSADYAIAYEYEQEIADYIQTIMTDYANKNIADMTLAELTDLYQMMRSIEETLRDARRLIGWSDAMTVYEAGDSIIEEQTKIGEKRKQNGISKVDDSIVNLSLSPVRAVLRMAGYNEDSALYHSIREIENGTREQKKFVMDAVKKFESLTTGKNASTYEKAIYDPYGKELIDKNGNKFHVTKMQMMQAIMSYEREMANDKLHHVSNGGFTFADIKLLGKGEVREAVSAKYAHTITLGSDVAVKFMSELANDKWAQEYMAEARNFFDVTAKEAINEANMKLKHRIVATGKNYIPYEVNSDFIVREINSENDIQQVISGYGMLKDLKEGASQPLIITGLNNVLDRHIEQVGNVAALAVPIRNFNKIWNVKATDGSTTVREKIKSNWGVGGEDLITQAVKDVQGSRKQDKSPIYKLYKKVKGNIIQGVFLGNWSVVLKQIGSMFTSTSMLNYRDPVSMMANLIATKANRDAIAAEVNKYTAVAWVRGQGLSDAELYELKTTAKRSKVGRAIDKLPPALNAAKWITQMDYDVALSLWKYAKEDTAKRTGLKGEELLKATADYYNDVIENTQSMSDALHRPEVQKSDNIASETLGIFKTDLYQNAGLLRVAFESRMAKPSRETNRALVKAVCGTLSSMCWASLVTSVMAAFRYKVDRYRDEEDDEITLENWLKVAGGDMLEEMFGYMLPLFGSEAAGLLKAWITGETYEFDNLTLEAINGLSKAMTSAGKLISEGEDEPEKILRVLKTLLVKGTSVFGVPANNVTRFLDAVRLHAKDIANGEFLSFEAGLTSPNAQRLYNAYIEGDADKIKKASRLYEDQKAIDSALRKQLRENDPRMKEAANAHIAGDYVKYNALIAEIVAEGIFDEALVTDALKAEINYIKNKDK